MKIRLIRHEVIPDCGSYELRYPDGRPSKYFYFENVPGRQLRPDLVERPVAERVAKIYSPAPNSTCSIMPRKGIDSLRAGLSAARTSTGAPV
jgi:hypothetical protein